MSEPLPPAGQEEPSSGGSSFRILIRALVSPREAFTELAREPRTALALLLLVLLGVVAMKAGQGKRIYYDGEKGQITNVSDANQYLSREYRKGWTELGTEIEKFARTT